MGGRAGSRRPRPDAGSTTRRGWAARTRACRRTGRAWNLGRRSFGSDRSERERVVSCALRQAFLLDPLLDPITGHGREPVDEEHAVEMVDLVLDDLGTKALCLEGNRRPVAVKGGDPDQLAT